MGQSRYFAGQETVQLIPVAAIRVLNSRSRDKRVYAGIVENISQIGLKKPVTITPSTTANDGKSFDLVCGEGRLEALKALGETEIPCFIVNASQTDSYLMSLVENIARRRHTNEELIGAIRALQERGYTTAQISAKTGLEHKYVNNMLYLLKHGEQRLIAAVERGWLSISWAEKISHCKDGDLQIAMQQAYDMGLLKGEQLIKLRRLIDKRAALGKGYDRKYKREPQKLTPHRLVQTYQREVRRQSHMVKKAEITERRMLFIVSALRSLMNDKHFVAVLRTEGIDDLPQPLAERLKAFNSP